jgi:hypothetical protein
MNDCRLLCPKDAGADSAVRQQDESMPDLGNPLAPRPQLVPESETRTGHQVKAVFRA